MHISIESICGCSPDLPPPVCLPLLLADKLKLNSVLQVFGNAPPSTMTEKFSDLLQFTTQVSRLMVTEIRRRASNKSTGESSDRQIQNCRGAIVITSVHHSLTSSVDVSYNQFASYHKDDPLISTSSPGGFVLLVVLLITTSSLGLTGCNF